MSRVVRPQATGPTTAVNQSLQRQRDGQGHASVRGSERPCLGVNRHSVIAMSPRDRLITKGIPHSGASLCDVSPRLASQSRATSRPNTRHPPELPSQ